MKTNFKYSILFLQLIILVFSCKDRPHTNPFDPDFEGDPDDWAPKNLQATVLSDSEIKLSWRQEDSILGFKLDRKTNTGNFSPIAELEANITEYTDTGLNYGDDYTYRLKAFTDENESGYVTSNSTNTSFPSPTSLIASPIDDQTIQLTWTDNCSFEVGFRLERQTITGAFTPIAELEADVTEYTDTGLNYGDDYTYRIKAFTDENESGYVSITTNMSIPSPTNLRATPIDDQTIQLNWIDNCSFEFGFRLERKTNTGNFTPIAELDADVTEFTDTSLLLVNVYTYRIKAFTDENESEYATSNTINHIFNFVFIYGGTFQMGSNDGANAEQPVHSVTVSDFYMSATEVTQAQWQFVMGSNPSYFTNCDQCPVEQVSWNDIQEFLQTLNNQTGGNYRLPTEAEWEYAARGGNQSQGYEYAGSNNVDEVAWYSSNSGGATHPVGQKQPNELGLYDMSGNVWEWCGDWFGYYSSAAQTNPQGPNTGSYRVLRGGSWIYDVDSCRVAGRYWYFPDYGNLSFGFRLVSQD